jgi:hypothetical protein
MTVVPDLQRSVAQDSPGEYLEVRAGQGIRGTLVSPGGVKRPFVENCVLQCPSESLTNLHTNLTISHNLKSLFQRHFQRF